MATDLSDTIAAEAVAPVSSTADGQTATARSISEILLAQNALDARASRTKRRLGMITRTLTSPGCLDIEGRANPPFNGGPV
jgi:hypothetical protein